MGSIWKMGRSSDRDKLSRGDARLFELHHFAEQKNAFPARGRFMMFRTCFKRFDEICLFKNVPEVPGSAQGASPTYWGAHIWVILAKNSKISK